MESTVAKAEFDKICNICPDYCIHWLECDGRKLIWFHSYSPESSSLFTEFKQYSKKEEKEERNHFVEELYFEKYIKQNQVVIIADSAGMGKSTILTSFMEKEKEKEDFQQWIIRINLNLYTDILLKIKNHDAALKKNIVEGQPPTPKIQFNFNFASFDPIKKDYGKLILESVINEARNEEETTRCFENRFFIYCFAKREMVIMVDGFDEINPDYGIVVMQILERLAEEKKNRIWITSRTIFKDQLEDKFNTFAYDLKPFCKEDGEIFLKEFWKQEWKEQKGSVIPNESDLENYVENLIKESYNRIGTVVGIPLQTKMIAEIFQEKDTDDDSKIIWQSCFEYLEMTKPSKKPNFMAKLKNIYILYEDFFKKCMFTYFLQEKAIVDLRKPFAKKIKRDVYINEYKAHKIFGVIALQDMHKDSLAAEEPEIIKNWLTDFDEGVENIGIINNFNGEGHPLFTHLTYAEYFAACYVHDKLIYDLSSARKTFEIANEILKKDVPVFAECLKFLLNENLCKKKLKDILNGKTALKFAMQHGFVNCVNLFISNKDLDDNFLYAVHSSQPEVVIYLTLYIYHFFYLKLKPSKHIAFCYLQQFITEAAEGSWENVDPTIAAFLKNILDLNQESLKPENMLPFAELIKFPYSVVQRKRINMSNAVETLKNSFALENIGKLSIENIKLIINLLEPITSQKWVAILIDDLCVRQDLTEAEKIQFFQELFNQINDPQEKMVFTNEMFNLVIRNDCGKRFDQILKNDKIPIHYFLINKEQLIECFTTACKNNLKRIIKITLRYFKKKQLYINSLHIACRYNATLEIIKVIQNTQHWSSINEQDVDGKTALLIALQNNCNLRKIEFLIENGADPNIPDKIKKTPWIYVIENADNETIEFFLRSYFNSNYHLESKLKLKTYFQNSDSFDINLKKNGRLRLHKAICDKDILFCKFLMRNGADVHIRDSEGKTPLYRACENGLYEFVKWLLLSGASYNEEDLEQLNIFDDDILNFLNTASTNFENLSKEKYTVTKNKYIRNATNRKKQTLSHIAVKSNILDNVKQFDIPYLKEQINKQDIDGNTALHFAMEGKNIEIIELLLEMGAYFDISNKKGITPLSMNTNNFVPLLKLADDEFRAINFRRHSHRFSTEENIRRLLKMKDVHGKTLLHYAVIFDKSVEVTCLLYYGADKNAKDKKCRTPLYYARHYMMKYMLINGALFDLKPYFTEETYIQSNHFARTIAHWFTLIYYEEYELLLENFELMKDRHHDGRCLIDDLHIMLHTRDINNRSLCYYILNDDKLLLRLLLKGIIIPFLFISHNLPSMKNMRIRKLIILLKYFAEELLENKVARVNLFKYYKWQILNLNISFPSLRFDRNDVDAILKTVQEKIDKYDVKSLSEFVKKYSHEKRT